MSHASQVDSIDLQKNKYITAALKELKHVFLSYFDYQQNYRYIEENLKIILYRDR